MIDLPVVTDLAAADEGDVLKRSGVIARVIIAIGYPCLVDSAADVQADIKARPVTFLRRRGRHNYFRIFTVVPWSWSLGGWLHIGLRLRGRCGVTRCPLTLTHRPHLRL